MKSKQEGRTHAWKKDSSKYIKPTTKGKCPYCKKPVKSLEHHIHDKHKEEQLPNK